MNLIENVYKCSGCRQILSVSPHITTIGDQFFVNNNMSYVLLKVGQKQYVYFWPTAYWTVDRANHEVFIDLAGTLVFATLLVIVH